MRIEPRYLFATAMAVTTLGLTGAIPAVAQPAPAAESKMAPAETSIPFVNMGGIRDWQAVDDTTLYVQDNGRKWYLARLLSPCTDLTFATGIGFETRGVNRLDKFGSVVVGGQRCPLASFIASGPPPAKKR